MEFVCGLILGVIGYSSFREDACATHPTGGHSATITATIGLDGREITSSQIWHLDVVTQWGIDAGRNYRINVEGEALVFETAPDEMLFLVPDNSPIVSCAADRFDEATTEGPANLAIAVQQLSGRCEVNPVGHFIVARNLANQVPTFAEFGWNTENGGILGPGGRPPKPAEPSPFSPLAEDVRAREFAFLTLTVEATDASPSSEMLGRFPWISRLLRADCGDGCYARSSRYVYANDFTTALPPLDCPKPTGVFREDDLARKGTACDPFARRGPDVVRFER